MMDMSEIAMPVLNGIDARYEQIMTDCLNDRMLILNNEIDSDILETYIVQIIRWNKEDKDLPCDKRKPIRIVINSPGGDLVIAMGLIDAIMQSKTKIIAIGVGNVSSAAFHIFIACKERIAFANTIFLMHDGEISITNSTSKARDTMAFFDLMEKRVKRHVLSCTKMDEEFYDSHYEQEFYMFPDNAKELGCVDKIVGIDDDIDCIF